MNETWLVTAFFFALFLLILYGAFLILSPFLPVITWAVILAILVYPLYTWLTKLLRGRATLAGLIVSASIALLVVVPGVELAWFLADEAVELVQSVRALVSGEGLAEWLAMPWVSQVIGWWDMVSFRSVDFKSIGKS